MSNLSDTFYHLKWNLHAIFLEIWAYTWCSPLPALSPRTRAIWISWWHYLFFTSPIISHLWVSRYRILWMTTLKLVFRTGVNGVIVSFHSLLFTHGWIAFICKCILKLLLSLDVIYLEFNENPRFLKQSSARQRKTHWNFLSIKKIFEYISSHMAVLLLSFPYIIS